MERRLTWIKLFMGLLIMMLGFSCQEEQPSPPNIVFIFSDELQLEDLGCYGGSIPTPNIDRLAAEGLRFTKAYTVASMCTPSRYALLTGRYPGRCAHPAFLEDTPAEAPYNVGWNSFLDENTYTIPRMLSGQGYLTGMAGKWHLGPHYDSVEAEVAALKNLDTPGADAALRRFQRWCQEAVRKGGGFDVANSVMYSNFDSFPAEQLHYHHFPWITAGAISFLEKAAVSEKPFFLMVTPTSLHGPHHAAGLNRDYQYTPEGRRPEVRAYNLDTKALRQVIDTMASPMAHRTAGLAFLDHQVGQILEWLEQKGLEEETLIVFVPDHNTEPAKATCYEKGIHIPMIVRWPGQVPAGATTDAQVQLTDWMSTLAEIVGAPPASPDSKSFLTVLKEPETEGRTYTFAESGYTRSVSDGRYKYIAFRYPDSLLQQMKNGTLEYAPNVFGQYWQGQSIIAARFYPHYFDANQLYDLENAPYEQYNLANDPAYADALVRMKTTLQRHLSDFQRPFPMAYDAFRDGEAFDRLKKATLRLDPNSIPWYKRDWGEIEWPPPTQH
ncbi:MAG: sulfatase-like hydrolase/transferase [Phaeodactylibacter sp.]|uniref:sulfatase family protein n=1 Tax=Phaeodactylibacter sp. TaxID=1940289 RepID=UPI0032EAFBE7